MRRLVVFLVCGMLVVLAYAWPSPAQAASVVMQWDYTQNTAAPAVGFFIYKQTDCAGTFAKVQTSPLPVTPLTFKDTAVALGTTYCWYATAVDANGVESVPSNTLKVFLSQPAQPQNLRGTIAP